MRVALQPLTRQQFLVRAQPVGRNIKINLYLWQPKNEIKVTRQSMNGRGHRERSILPTAGPTPTQECAGDRDRQSIKRAPMKRFVTFSGSECIRIILPSADLCIFARHNRHTPTEMTLPRKDARSCV